VITFKSSFDPRRRSHRAGRKLEELAANARNALTEGSAEQIKQTLAALVDRVEISADRRANWPSHGTDGLACIFVRILLNP